MGQSNPSVDGTQSLDHWLRLMPQATLRQRLTVLLDILHQVQAFHAQGLMHGAIRPDNIALDDQGRPSLSEPHGNHLFGGEFCHPERCPPGFLTDDTVELPTRLDAAVGVLGERGDCPDPRRIDLYQIGVVFYHLLTGDSILAYMYTARGKSRVPVSVRPILRGLLGYNPAERYLDCSQAIQAVEAAMAEWGEDSAGDPFPFQRLGPYRILGRIGSGGMGDVYRGYEEDLDRQVAIKVLPAELAQDGQFVRLFRSEAAAAARIAHPGVVPVYGVGEDRGRHYFAMQYIEGESVAERLARCGRLPLRQALNIAQQCLEALGAAHAYGVIHRDIKPGNLLIEEKTGRVVLVDFGLSARLRDPDGTGHENLFLGTVEYLAPEQIRGDPPDERSDLYSCGAVLYQMLSGQAPTGAETPTGVLFERAYAAPRPLTEIAPDVPEPVARIVARLMAKDPADRYASCAEALLDVAAATESVGVFGQRMLATPSPRGQAALRRRVLGMGAVVAASLALGVWGILGGRGPWRIEPPPKGTLALLPPALPHDQWFDLLPEIDPDRDRVHGTWQRDETSLRCGVGLNSRILLPVCADGAYDLEVEFTRLPDGDAEGNVEIFLPVGMNACALSLSGAVDGGGASDRVHGLTRVGGYTPGEDSGGANPTAKRPGNLTPGRSHRVRIEVRGDHRPAHIAAAVDDEPVVDWQGDPSQLDVHPAWHLPEPQRLGLGAGWNPVVFTSVRFRPRTGVAWRVEPSPPGGSRVHRPGANRALILGAASAEIHGQTLREATPGVLGTWTDDRDWVAWRFLAEPDTTYRIELHYACHEASQGSTYTISIASSGEPDEIVARGRVDATGQYWENYRTIALGTWTTGRPGPYTLSLKPSSKPGQAVMNLRWIRLLPVEVAGQM